MYKKIFARTHCIHGHELMIENIYVHPKTGVIVCRTCSYNSVMENNRGLDKKLFGGNRELAIQRDGEKCVHCGITRDEHREKYGYDITVDHIDGNGASKPKELRNNSLENLQTLCSQCHVKKDFARKGIAKLTEEDVKDIRMFFSKGLKIGQIHKGYQMVIWTTIYQVVHGRTWKWVK